MSVVLILNVRHYLEYNYFYEHGRKFLNCMKASWWNQKVWFKFIKSNVIKCQRRNNEEKIKKVFNTYLFYFLVF